jgi:LmbE family N-acetylglucosaminyl deacetylase
MPGTLVTFHAHPDDEAITTGGVMAMAAADGHRVVLVLATAGELGEVPAGLLSEGEDLASRRRAEQEQAAEILGVARVAYLGYGDSGMAGEPTNSATGAFAAAPVDEAAGRLAEILREEDAEVLTVYDDNGGYGHPDHIQVHRVGVRAAEMAGTPRVFEQTLNRDHVLALMRGRAEEMGTIEGAPDPETFDMGKPAAIITTTVDVGDFVEKKRAAMRAHASQIPEDSFFLQLPPDAFREAFGYEWFIHRGAAPDATEHSLFEN